MDGLDPWMNGWLPRREDILEEDGAGVEVKSRDGGGLDRARVEGWWIWR